MYIYKPRYMYFMIIYGIGHLYMYMYAYLYMYCIYIHVYLQSADGSNIFYYCYNLLDNYITSELFKVTEFKPEKASIRIMTTRERLGMFFTSQEDMKVHPHSVI